MKVHPRSRRMFLAGSGVCLTIPFLESLMRRSARGQDEPRPVRYVQVVNLYGATTRHFYGSLATAETNRIEANVKIKPLREVQGDISLMVGKAFDSYRGKLNLIHGMDVPAANPNHNRCFPTCASGYAKGLDGDLYPPASGQSSVDVLMAQSPTVYPTPIGLGTRLLTLNPFSDGGSDSHSFSWQDNGQGTLEMVRPLKATLGLEDLLAPGFADQEPTFSSETADTKVLEAVYADYQRIAQHPHLGASDRTRLEAYMALLHDSARPGVDSAGCTAPGLEEESNGSATASNQIRLLAAAMACGLNRVASLTLLCSAGYDVRHPEHHEKVCFTDDVGLVDDFARFGRIVAELVATFDGLPDGQGTLLDNSIVYWSSQYGNTVPADIHRRDNLPVLVAGGAGGQLTTGYYADFRKDGHLSDDVGRGIPLNNLLVTFMNCMGMGSTEYETGGKPGYGEYSETFFASSERADTPWWSSTEGKRSPLPFLYSGPKRS